MFKNRIRTAAIAGIAALATGVSGAVVATPAFAQDGTVATPANPTHTPDYELRAALAEVNEYIQGYELPTIGEDYDTSEEAISDAVKAELAIAREELANAVETQQLAREAALEAEARWDAVLEAAQALDAVVAENSNVFTDTDVDYVDPITGRTATPIEPTQGYNSTGDEITITDSASLIDTINRYAAYIQNEGTPAVAGYITTEVTDHDQYQRDPATLLGNNGRVDAAWDGNTFVYERTYDNATDAAADAQRAELEALQTELAALIASAAAPEGDFTEPNGRAFNAYYDGLVELQAQVESALADLDAAEAALFNAQRASGAAEAAQALRTLWDATDQRNILRKIVGQLEASANFYDLAVDDKDALVPNTGLTVREVYESAIGQISDEIEADKDLLDDGIQNVDATSNATYRLAAAGLLDQAAVDEAEKADREAERDQAIIDGLDPDEEDDNDNGSIREGGSSFDAPEFTGGSSDLGGFGIAAVIAAIIGVLALVVPNIQNFL